MVEVPSGSGVPASKWTRRYEKAETVLVSSNCALRRLIRIKSAPYKYRSEGIRETRRDDVDRFLEYRSPGNVGDDR